MWLARFVGEGEGEKKKGGKKSKKSCGATDRSVQAVEVELCAVQGSLRERVGICGGVEARSDVRSKIATCSLRRAPRTLGW